MQTTIDHTGNYVAITDEPAVPTLTQRAVAELSEFNGQISSLQPYGELTVAADGIGKVEEAHKAVKRLNAAIEKKRKELKAGALEYGRTVDSIAKQLSSAVDAIEGKLGAERERWEAEREAEKREKDAEKLAEKQRRIDAMQFAGIPVDLAAAELPEDEWHWWLSTNKRKADELREKVEEERRAAEEFAKQQRAERDALAAKLKAEQEELSRQREKIAAEREELRQAQIREQREKANRESELLEKRRAEERKRREDAAKPELERLQITIDAMKLPDEHWQPLPWWAPEFVTRFNQFAEMMENFVKEGSDQ